MHTRNCNSAKRPVNGSRELHIFGNRKFLTWSLRSYLSPGALVRRAAARAAEDDLGLDGGGLTPELAELIKRTFRGVHLLA